MRDKGTRDKGTVLLSPKGRGTKGPSPCPFEWTFLVNCFDSTEASIIEAMLSEEGIPILKKSQGTGAYTEVVMGRALSGMDIYVPDNQLDTAREIISFDGAQFDEEIDFVYKGNDEEEPGILRILQPAGKKIITLIIIIPMILGLLYYLLGDLPSLIQSIF